MTTLLTYAERTMPNYAMIGRKSLIVVPSVTFLMKMLVLEL